MKKILTVLLSMIMVLGLATSMVGCTEEKKELSKITIVWYPNESGGELEEARTEVGKIIEKATGLKVEHKLTTDYAVAIESLVNGTAQIGYMGPQGYVECHDKNKKILPLVVSSGESGTLDDAKYYSWLAVPEDKASDYKKGDGYSLDNIVGKKISFVSTSSTSGFKVPTTSIASYFSSKDKYKNLTANDLMEGGSGKFFSEVLYGDSHQGSAVNLLTGKCDIAAFCDTTMINYSKAVKGDVNKIGTTYAINNGADAPFTDLAGKKFTTITVTPVLNSPFAANTKVLSDDLIKKIVKEFTSDEVTNNEKVFIPTGSTGKGFFAKKGKEHFMSVEDKWFNPIRELSKS